MSVTWWARLPELIRVTGTVFLTIYNSSCKLEEYVGVEFGERRAVGWVDPKIQKEDVIFPLFFRAIAATR